MPDGLVYPIAERTEKLQDVLFLYRDSAVAIAGTATYSLPVLDTEFGRTIPNASTPTDGGAPGADTVRNCNSKKISIKARLASYVGFCVQCIIYEDSIFAGTNKRLVRSDYMLLASAFQLDHDATDRYIFIDFYNVQASAIASGEITVISRL